MENIKKRKFDIKVWLATLGIALFSCGMALCAKAAETYQRVDAYEYQDNGVFIGWDDTDDDANDAIEHFIEMLISYSNFNEQESTVATGFYGGFYESYNDVFVKSNIMSENQFYFYELNHDEHYWRLTSYYFHTEQLDYYVDFYYVNNDISIDEALNVIFADSSFDNFFPFLNYALSYNAPQSTGNFLTALTDFVQLITSGIVDLGRGVAIGVVSMASSLFLDNGSLSIMGGIIGIFAGIALAVGITTKVYTWVTSLGN